MLERARNAAVTYGEVGATANGRLPEGFAHVRRRFVVGAGERTFAAAAQRLSAWGMHEGSGMRVLSTSSVAELDAVAVLLFGGWLSRLPAAPVRVIQVVNESNRHGFAYGTLPGHPFVGEELFIVTHEPTGDVHLEVTAFARPAARAARLAGPATRFAQSLILRRYAAAVREPAPPTTH